VTGLAGQTVLAGRKEYTGEPISMSLKDADVREVLRTFARLSGLNIVIQPGVRGTVTVELERVPWDQALDQILKINGLGYELEGNIMRIAPLNVLEQEARRALWSGVEKLAGAVKATLGPRGRNAVIDKGWGGPTVTV